jgi:hypothetical protein
VTVADAGGTYSGSPIAATALVGGVTSLEGVAPSVAYYAGDLTDAQIASTALLPGAPRAAGTYTAEATFAGSANYAQARSAPAQFTIARAAPTVTVSDGGKLFDGTACPATASANGGASLEGVAPSVVYYAGNLTDAEMAAAVPLSGAPSAAGAYTVEATFAGSADYASARSAPAYFMIISPAPPPPLPQPVFPAPAPSPSPSNVPVSIHPQPVTPMSPPVVHSAVQGPLVKRDGSGGKPPAPPAPAADPTVGPAAQVMRPGAAIAHGGEFGAGGMNLPETVLLSLNDLALPAASVLDVGDLPAEPAPPQKVEAPAELPARLRVAAKMLASPAGQGAPPSSHRPWFLILSGAALVSALGAYVWQRVYARRRRRLLDVRLFPPAEGENRPEGDEFQPSSVSLSEEEIEHGQRQ